MGIQTCTVTLEINMTVSQKIGNWPPTRPSYITSGHIAKEWLNIPQGHYLTIFITALFVTAETGNKLDGY